MCVPRPIRASPPCTSAAPARRSSGRPTTSAAGRRPTRTRPSADSWTWPAPHPSTSRCEDALLFQPEIRDHTEERTSGEGYRIRMVVRHAGASEGLRKSELGFESELSLRYLQVDVAWEDGIGVKTYTLKSLRAAPEND